ncbi:MAG: hypothetical protein K1W39_03715 [Lachnospiraceae bacterium]
MFEKKISDEDRKKMERKAKKNAKASKKKESTGAGVKDKLISVCKVVVLPLIFVGIVVCALYLVMQNKLEEESLKDSVLAMREDVAVNTFVKSEDAGKYFEVISVDLTAIPTCAYKSLDELPKDGFYIENAMTKTQMVMKDDIADKDIVMDKYKNDYEITSFPTESFDGGVNGSLRKGDIVDVYALNPETELLELFAENVYMSEVYDNVGNRITKPDEVATSFTVLVTSEKVESVNLAVVYGKVQIYLKTE